MRCELAMAMVTTASDDEAARRAALAHVAACPDCRRASAALAALRADRERPVPRPPAGAVERALRRVTAAPPVMPRQRGFWLGAGVGAALAASVAVAVTWALLDPAAVPRAAIPAVTFALNEVRNVNVAVDSPEPLMAAEIQVVLSGDIDIDGFAQQRELRWFSDLDRGVNQLTLPVIARSESGGQIVVAIVHGGKRRTFVVDVHAQSGSAPI